MLLGAQLLHQEGEQLLSTRLLQVSQLLMKVDNFIQVVQRGVVHVIDAVHVLITIPRLIVFRFSINVDVGVFLILNDEVFTMIFNFCLFCLLLLLKGLLADLNALLTQVGQGLNDVWIVILHAVWHLAVHEERCQTQYEPLHLEILLDLSHFCEDELEEVFHGTLLLEDGHSLTHVVP